MKRLVLVRHAKSSWSDPGAADFDRKLNKRGKRDAPFMAEKLAERGVRADLIISSPAKRAKKTAQHMANGIGYESSKIYYTADAYSFSATDLFEIIRKIDDKYGEVLFVGHNFGITDLAEQLTGETLMSIPTAGIVSMISTITSWAEIRPHCATLQFFDFPKKYLK
jgi:phosphohistidine phosphatase